MEKVVRSDFRNQKEVTMPSGLSVRMYTSFLFSDVQEFNKIEDQLEASLLALEKLIIEWNWYEKEEDDKPVVINRENIAKLPTADIKFLNEQVEKIADTEKKE